MSRELNLSLYGMTAEMKALEEMLMIDGGELTEEHTELEETIVAMIQSKTDGCVGFIQTLEDDIALGKEKKKLIDDFMSVRKKAITRFKDYVAICMDQLETKKLKGSIAEISERKPSKKVDITDENKIPAQYTTVETVVTIDRKKIATDLKAGIEIPGAALVDGARSISFKLKTVG